MPQQKPWHLPTAEADFDCWGGNFFQGVRVAVFT